MKDHTELLKESRNRLQSLMLSMLAHPDCTEGSEFDDMTSLAQYLIDKIDKELENDMLNDNIAQESKYTKEQLDILGKIRNAIIVLSTSPSEEEFVGAINNLSMIAGQLLPNMFRTANENDAEPKFPNDRIG